MIKKIAVISDMHIGVKARCEGLCPVSQRNNYIGFDEKFKERFFKHINKYSIRADYLIFPGDITTKGKEDEFILASEFIYEIASALKVKNDHIIYVPGNHDANWGLQESCDSIEQWKAIRYSGSTTKSNLIFNKINLLANGTSLFNPYFCAWDNSETFILGYNSSWNDDKEADVHHGDFDEESIDQIKECLSNVTDLNNKLKIFIVHHHPSNYSDPISSDYDFSCMTNAEKLLDVLREYNFDLFIHGHKHNPKFEINLNAMGLPIVVLSAGSFSAILDPRWSGVINNQFHIINIDGRNAESRLIYGYIENWTYLAPSGWKASSKANGIVHKISFGNHVLQHKLIDDLRKTFKIEFCKDRSIILREFFKSYDKYEYMSTTTILKVIEQLQPEFKYNIFGETKEDMALVIPREEYNVISPHF